MKYSVEQMRSIAEERLSQKRFEHCLRVANYAKMIAAKENVDPEKMYIAGLLHDIAKEVGNAEILRLSERTGRLIPSVEIKEAHGLHGLAGACVAYEEFGIRDEEILMAIAYHSGRVAMTTPEKILFLSDGLDACYKYGLDSTRIWQQQDLDSALTALCVIFLLYCVKKGVQLGPRTQDSFDYIMEHLKASDLKAEEDYLRLRNTADEIVDKAMQLYLTHRVKLRSVKNIRDAGNYPTASGRRIRKNVLIRSGALSGMTEEDAEQLRGMGINCIIDLRTEEEVQADPEHADGFLSYHCPLPTLELGDEQKRFAEFADDGLFDDEAAWYTSKYMQGIDMEELYRSILMRPESVAQLRRVFSILLDETTQGVLFHGDGGRDRTGAVTMLIQLVLGVDTDDIINDFYASALPYYREAEKTVLLLEKYGYSVDLSEKARETFGIGTDLVRNFELWCRESRAGSTEGYLTEVLGLTPDKRQKLYEKYLEPEQEKM